MGGDLIIHYFIIDKYKKIKKIKKQLIEETNKLTIEDIDYIKAYYENVYGIIPDEDDEHILVHGKKEFNSNINDLFECLNFRDVT